MTPRKPNPKWPNCRPDIDTAIVVARYQSGESSKLIAADLGCSVRTVFLRLASVGVTPRGQGAAPKPRGPASPRWTGGDYAAWRRWQKRHPGRRAIHVPANRAVAQAIRSGRLIRPSICESCGQTGGKIDAAHWNYREPLAVRWLCKSCHSRWDRAVPKTLRAEHPGPSHTAEASPAVVSPAPPESPFPLPGGDRAEPA